MMDANSACSTSSTNLPTNVWPFRYRVGSSRSMSSMCSPTCSSCAAFPGMSVPIMAGVRCQGDGVFRLQVSNPTSTSAIGARSVRASIYRPEVFRSAYTSLSMVSRKSLSPRISSNSRISRSSASNQRDHAARWRFRARPHRTNPSRSFYAAVRGDSHGPELANVALSGRIFTIRPAR